MAAIAGYKGKVYAVDDSVAFSTVFSSEATTESGVTKIYQIDDSTKRVWDRNQALTVSGYWAFQEFALSTTSGADSGLASTTQYYFKIAIDGGGVTEYDITTGGGTVTWANVVSLIDAEITGDGATCEFIDGDVRIHSDDTTTSSDISCSAGTTGTSLFGQGSVPAVGSLETVNYTDIDIDHNSTTFSGGVDYVQGRVNMSHTGFTSLVVDGYYCAIIAIAQIQGWSINFNWAVVDITDMQDSTKASLGVTRNGSYNLNGFAADTTWIDLAANSQVFIKLYFDYPNTKGFAFWGLMNNNLNLAPNDVVREGISGEITGDWAYVTT